MGDRETWRFINTFAPWIAALATFTAVLVSLYLARRASRLDLRVSAAVVQIVTEGEASGKEDEYFRIHVVNHGRETVVTAIGWGCVGSKLSWVSISQERDLSTTLPAKLEFGAMAQFYFSTETFGKRWEHLLTSVGKSMFPKVRVQRLRVSVWTSTGQRFRAPLDSPMRKFILAQAARIG